MKNTRKNSIEQFAEECKTLGSFGTTEPKKFKPANFAKAAESDLNNFESRQEIIDRNEMVEKEIASEVRWIETQNRRDFEKESNKFEEWIGFFFTIMAFFALLKNMYDQYIKHDEKRAIENYKMIADEIEKAEEKAEKDFQEANKKRTETALQRIDDLQHVIYDKIDAGKIKYDEKFSEIFDNCRYYAEHQQWGKLDNKINYIYNEYII